MKKRLAVFMLSLLLLTALVPTNAAQASYVPETFVLWAEYMGFSAEITATLDAGGKVYAQTIFEGVQYFINAVLTDAGDVFTLTDPVLGLNLRFTFTDAGFKVLEEDINVLLPLLLDFLGW